MLSSCWFVLDKGQSYQYSYISDNLSILKYMKAGTRSKVGNKKNNPSYRTPSRWLAKPASAQNKNFKNQAAVPFHKKDHEYDKNQ